MSKQLISRRTFHVVMALILVFCVVSPFVESAINWNDSVFSTGYDTESTLAILVLLLELVLSSVILLVFLCQNTQLKEGIVANQLYVTPERGSVTAIPELSPPVPLRI